MAEIVGGSFTALTVNRNVAVAVYWPSLTLTVMVVAPFWLVAGVTVTVRLVPEPPKTMLFVGTSVGLEEPLLKIKLAAAVSASPIVKLRGPVEVSSSMARSARVEMVGEVFTVLTVKTNVSLAEFAPSLTVMVMVDVPVCPEAGVIVTVRLAPLPPKTMLLVGTRLRLDEFRPKVRLLTGVSTSPMANEIAAVGVSTVVN